MREESDPFLTRSYAGVTKRENITGPQYTSTPHTMHERELGRFGDLKLFDKPVNRQDVERSPQPRTPRPPAWGLEERVGTATTHQSPHMQADIQPYLNTRVPTKGPVGYNELGDLKGPRNINLSQGKELLPCQVGGVYLMNAHQHMGKGLPGTQVQALRPHGCHHYLSPTVQTPS